MCSAKPVSRNTRVCIVDDSASMRALIRHIIAREPDLEVVGEAGDPYEAREVIKAVSPDVLTLDIEMPRMNGLDFLTRIMRLRPMPVVMVSSLTTAGANVTVAALAQGAVDYVLKPGPGDRSPFAELPDKIRTAAATRPAPRAGTPKAMPADTRKYGGDRIVAIGASTGGVDALGAILSRFPKLCPPTVIIQHMPGQFTRSFAARLERTVGPEVREAEDGMILKPGLVVIAPGTDTHLKILGRGILRCSLEGTPPLAGHRPSVDVLFNSLSAVAERVVGVVLTGMGSDGAEGLRRLRDGGAETLVQDQASCMVFGMPRAALERGAADAATPLSLMADRILAAATAPSIARSGRRGG